jgi:hypothetical protein
MSPFRSHRFLISVLLPFALAACSGAVTKKDCQDADYYDIGLKDGKHGESAEIARYRDQCSREGVAIDEARYNYGRKVGLAEYCDEGRAEDDAKKGNFDSVCSREKVPPYQAAYAKELDDARADREKELKKVQESKNELQAKQDKIQAEISAIDQQKNKAIAVDTPSDLGH